MSNRHPTEFPLHAAVRAGDLTEVDRRLDLGDPVDAQDNHRMTPLHYAAERKNLEMIQLLLSYGANIAAQDSHGMSVLHHGASRDYLTVTSSLLISMGAEIDARDAYGRNPLMLAAADGNHLLTEILLHLGADFRLRDRWGRSVCHLAVLRRADLHRESVFKRMRLRGGPRRAKTLEALASVNGIDLNVQDPAGNTPLHYARHDAEMVETLLALGANPSVKNHEGHTPGDLVLREWWHKTLRLFSSDPKDADTALRCAAMHGDHRFVRRLLDEGVSANSIAKSGATPLALAAFPSPRLFHGHKNLVRLLLRRGADTNILYGERGTLLHVAAQHGREPLAIDLLAHGAATELRDGRGRTPLHLAALKGRTGVLRLLLKAGADVNARDASGATPLHLAANANFGKHCSRTIRLLLEAGASPADLDSEGRTPSDYAAKDDLEALAALSEA